MDPKKVTCDFKFHKVCPNGASFDVSVNPNTGPFIPVCTVHLARQVRVAQGQKGPAGSFGGVTVRVLA